MAKDFAAFETVEEIDHIGPSRPLKKSGAIAYEA
jgi:hypothetical protein